MMRVLITGITGFVGRHLARRLDSSDDVEVHGLVGSSEHPAIAEATRLFTADIRDDDALTRAIDESDPDAIFHLAGLSHVGESWKRPADYFQVNFHGTHNLLRAATGRRVLFASSAEVYGTVPEEEQPIAESRSPQPRSPYALTKASAEELAVAHGAIVARSFNSIGPGQSSQFALPSFASQLAAIKNGHSEAVIKVGDLSPKRDFLHVFDAVAGYEAMLRHGEAGQVYNLASGRAFSIEEALDALREISGVETKVETDPARVRPVDIPLLQGDVSKLQALGWQSRYDLRRALEDLWQETLQPLGESR